MTIAAITDDSAALDVCVVYDDYRPYLDVVGNLDVITNVVTRGQRAQTDEAPARETKPEVYAKEPVPLNTYDLIHAQARDRLCQMFRETV